MSEQGPLITPEAPKQPETGPEYEAPTPESQPERQIPTPETRESVDKLEEAAEAQAASSSEVKAAVAAEIEVDSKPQHYVNRELLSKSLRSMLNRVRQHLSLPDRTLSKVVHQPAVDAISNISAKTLARPSGILSGGLFALLGSAMLLYLAKHYGFRYNFLLFALLFVGGYCLGTLVELVIFLFRRKNSKQ